MKLVNKRLSEFETKLVKNYMPEKHLSNDGLHLNQPRKAGKQKRKHCFRND